MLAQNNANDLDVTLPEDYEHDLSALQSENREASEQSYDSQEVADQVDLDAIGVDPGNNLADDLNNELNELSGLNADMQAEAEQDYVETS